MGACKVIILDFIWIDSKMIKILTNLDKFDANETIGTNLVQIWHPSTLIGHFYANSLYTAFN